MSPNCKASLAAFTAAGPGDAGAAKEPSAGGEAPMSTDDSAGHAGRSEDSAGSANVDPGANARLKKSLEEHEPVAVRTLVSPELPSQAEIDEHNVSHLPYRSWCRFCVMGRGKADFHKKVEDKEGRIPTIACD